MGNSQDHLSLIVRSASSFRTLGLLVVILAHCSRVSAQNEDIEMAFKLRQNTVRVSSTEEGFGFIVGERDGYLYIATAKHVLGRDDIPGSHMPAQAKVNFFSNQGEDLTADVLNTFEGDLAVLRIKKPPNFPWVKECLAPVSSYKFGTKVWYIGRARDWSIPATPGAIANFRHTKWEVEIDGLKVLQGTSGAPMVTSHGIIGMVLESAADTTHVLLIQFIEVAFEHWNYPWDVTEAKEAERPPQPTPAPTPAPPPAETPAPVMPTPPSTPMATIQLFYSGDIYGCTITDVQLQIGDRLVTPIGAGDSKHLIASNVPSGYQNYTIAANIACPNLGFCEASGTGQLFISNYATYDMGWRGTGTVECRMILVGPSAHP